MAKNLVVYFSLTGNTAKAAGIIAGEFKADSIKLDTHGKGFLKVLSHHSRKYLGREIVKLPDIDLGKYDVIFIGGPVWSSKPAPAVRDFLKRANLKGKKVVVFLTGHKSSVIAEKVSREFVEKAGAKLLGFTVLERHFSNEDVVKQIRDIIK